MAAHKRGNRVFAKRARIHIGIYIDIVYIYVRAKNDAYANGCVKRSELFSVPARVRAFRFMQPSEKQRGRRRGIE